MPQDTIQLGNLEDVLSNVTDSAVLYKELTDKKKEQEKFKKESEAYADWALPATFLLLGIIWLLVRLIHGRNKEYVTLPGGDVYYEDETDVEIPVYHEFIEYDKNYSDKQIATILKRYYPWFGLMNTGDQDKFSDRLNRFIKEKIFRSYSGTTDKEIPVLISTPAILFSFGLDEYKFTGLDSFDIYDQVFNTQNNVHNELTHEYFIRVSIPLMMEEINSPDKARNSLLKAYALAFYHLQFESGLSSTSGISTAFLEYEHEANRIFDKEKAAGGMLYESSSLLNFTAFWAGSVELFFGNPLLLNKHYPSLFNKLSLLLKQDPLKTTS